MCGRLNIGALLHVMLKPVENTIGYLVREPVVFCATIIYKGKVKVKLSL
jgi:hypothetical protein